MDTADLIAGLQDLMNVAPDGPGFLRLEGDPMGEEGKVGAQTLQLFLREAIEQLRDLQGANEDLARGLADVDRDLAREIDDLQADHLKHIPELTVQLNELKKRVVSHERALYLEVFDEPITEAMLRDIAFLWDRVDDLEAWAEGGATAREPEPEEDGGLPERFSLYALKQIPGVSQEDAGAIVDTYGFLRPEELYTLSNRYTLQKLDRVSVSVERAIWTYLDDNYPELRHG